RAAGSNAEVPAARAAASSIPWGFPEAFIVSQTALPALLYLPGTQSIRVIIRVSAFAISLFALAWWQTRPDDGIRPHKASAWLAGVTAILAVMLFHPGTSSLVG